LVLCALQNDENGYKAYRARSHVQPEELLGMEVRHDARHVREHVVRRAGLVLVVHALPEGAAAAVHLELVETG
jgi:hypothetical protein